MRGILTKTDVSDYEEGREASAEKANGLYDGTLRIISFGSVDVFGLRSDRDTK